MWAFNVDYKALISQLHSLQGFEALTCNNSQTSNIRPTLVGNEIVDNSDVFGASYVSCAPTTSSFST